MTLPNVIRSIILVVVSSFVVAYLGQYLLYLYHLADGICWTSDCPEETKSVIISTTFKTLLFSAVYFLFAFPTTVKVPGIEMSILLSCLLMNVIHFNNVNAYLCLVPYNFITVFFYYDIKKKLNVPFKIFPFAVQEMLLLLLLVCSYVYINELFVLKGLQRDIVLLTGTEKMLDRIFSIAIWTVIILHILWLAISLVKKRPHIAQTYFKRFIR